MKLAIMQPYFFPYIGYWQLMNAVDRFVIYDDVSFIKGGWINRNRLLINGRPSYFTAPLHNPSSNKRICDIFLQSSPRWRNKLIKTVENTYRRSPFFTVVFPVIEQVIHYETENLVDFVQNQIQTMAAFMKINTDFVLTSRQYGNNELSGEKRILDICKREGAAIYINLQGGQKLYQSHSFRTLDIDLNFIVMNALPYKQRSVGFVPFLSIIDALMEIGPTDIKRHLNAYSLIDTCP